MTTSQNNELNHFPEFLLQEVVRLKQEDASEADMFEQLTRDTHNET